MASYLMTIEIHAFVDGVLVGYKVQRMVPKAGFQADAETMASIMVAEALVAVGPVLAAEVADQLVWHTSG